MQHSVIELGMDSRDALPTSASSSQSALVIKALTGTNVQLVRNDVQLLLAVSRQIDVLGRVLTNQTIDAFVATALPRHWPCP